MEIFLSFQYVRTPKAQEKHEETSRGPLSECVHSVRLKEEVASSGRVCGFLAAHTTRIANTCCEVSLHRFLLYAP